MHPLDVVGYGMSTRSGKFPQPDHCCGQRDDRQVVACELLVARGHPAELFDPGKEADHLLPLPVGSLIERTSSPVMASSLDHTGDAPAA